jgi:hypothetical protein
MGLSGDEDACGGVAQPPEEVLAGGQCHGWWRRAGDLQLKNYGLRIQYRSPEFRIQYRDFPDYHQPERVQNRIWFCEEVSSIYQLSVFPPNFRNFPAFSK